MPPIPPANRSKKGPAGDRDNPTAPQDTAQKDENPQHTAEQGEQQRPNRTQPTRDSSQADASNDKHVNAQAGFAAIEYGYLCRTKERFACAAVRCVIGALGLHAPSRKILALKLRAMIPFGLTH